MSATGAFYQSQADLAGREADAAGLPQQREIFLRSQRAWQALADRIALTEIARKERDPVEPVTAPG